MWASVFFSVQAIYLIGRRRLTKYVHLRLLKTQRLSHQDKYISDESFIWAFFWYKSSDFIDPLCACNFLLVFCHHCPEGYSQRFRKLSNMGREWKKEFTFFHNWPAALSLRDRARRIFHPWISDIWRIPKLCKFATAYLALLGSTGHWSFIHQAWFSLVTTFSSSNPAPSLQLHSAALGMWFPSSSMH